MVLKGLGEKLQQRRAKRRLIKSLKEREKFEVEHEKLERELAKIRRIEKIATKREELAKLRQRVVRARERAGTGGGVTGWLMERGRKMARGAEGAEFAILGGGPDPLAGLLGESGSRKSPSLEDLIAEPKRRKKRDSLEKLMREV